MPQKKKTQKTPGQGRKAFAVAHKSLLAPIRASESEQPAPTLGHARAVVIVCACANTSPMNLSRTLQQLGVNGISFQACVFRSVTHLGYDINEDDIPNSPDTTLIQVVSVIEDAPLQEQS